MVAVWVGIGVAAIAGIGIPAIIAIRNSARSHQKIEDRLEGAIEDLKDLSHKTDQRLRWLETYVWKRVRGDR